MPASYDRVLVPTFILTSLNGAPVDPQVFYTMDIYALAVSCRVLAVKLVEKQMELNDYRGLLSPSNYDMKNFIKYLHKKRRREPDSYIVLARNIEIVDPFPTLWTDAIKYMYGQKFYSVVMKCMHTVHSLLTLNKLYTLTTLIEAVDDVRQQYHVL